MLSFTSIRSPAKGELNFALDLTLDGRAKLEKFVASVWPQKRLKVGEWAE